MERGKSSLQGVGVPSLQGVGVPSGVVDQGVSQGAAAGTALPPLRKRKLNASGSRKTSTVLEEFNILPDEPEPIAACKHCHKRYRCDPKTHGTSNMLAHSKVCYKNPALLLKDPNQTNLVSGEGGFLVPTSQRFNAAACRKAINTFVILDEHSFRVVEGVGFKQMCKQLQPQMAIPTRRTVARDCFQLYLAEKSRLKAFFKSDCTRVALTTDCWTSIQNLSYMATTAHFIDTAWKYQKKIISFSLVPNHKGDTIGMKVEDVLREWGLRKVSTITLDNATANDVAVSYLDRRLKSKNALLGVGDYLHMRCAAHVLNLVVRDGEKEHEGSIESVRTAVRFVRSSPQRAMKFKECVELAGITCKKKLCLDVSTRWNSTYLMLDAAEKFEAAFDNMIDEDPGYIEYFDLLTGPPGSQDWKKVRAFVVFLQTFYEATKVFSTSQEVSLHLAFHNLSSILCELQEASFNLNSYVAPMISHMKVKYDKYWGDVGKVNHFLYYGVIFDPRFKFNYIEWSFNDMYGHSSDLAKKNIECVKTSLFKLYNWHKSDHDKNVGASPLSAPGSTSLGEASSQPKEPSPFTRANAFKKHLKEKDTIENENELENNLGSGCVGNTCF
ncbi:zinc finger BED domain-containing protein RICESLEEPER 1-like [Lathyrus oleraceus]|uniref:zinc finger BED domain-containing protein RICESLEEPER 1-like n=2 Tax=Pisum sativum TaxID=3888 RepID=UPI0021D0BC8F|nr:zinc finger BED domain-containing protein RICESLEEPER 1-like [Pisum sativum]